MDRLGVGALRRAADRWWKSARKLRRGASPAKQHVLDAQHRDGASASVKKHLSYEDWIGRNDTLSDADRTLIRSHIAGFTRTPRLSVLLAIRDDAPGEVREALDSVTTQLYDRWELCVVADASLPPETLARARDLARSDPRIRLSLIVDDASVAARVNEALAGATGEWVVLLDQHDVLAEHALYLVAEAVNTDPDAAIVYSDEDEIDRSGRRSSPYFKPDWDYDLLLGTNLLGHLAAYRTELVRRAGGVRDGFEGALERDLALRILELAQAGNVRHVPFVLYHRRRREDSKTPLRQAREAARRAVSEHLARTGQAAVATALPDSSDLRIRRDLRGEHPLVSVVIPTKDRRERLQTCLDGLLNRTDYQPLELVVVDNGSTEPDARSFLEELRSDGNVAVVEDRGPFNFSRLCNAGLTASRGEIAVLLNNDIEVIDGGWLEEMVSHAVRPDVGAVGAKLYYADGRLQHGGVVLGPGGVAGHVFLGAGPDEPGYFNRLNLTHNLSCVTAACLATRRKVYEEVGGFDERLAVEYNDVDFCIRVRQAGYKIIWTPYAELRHHERASRGDVRRLPAERAYIRERWGPVLDADPFYNPNLALDGRAFQPAQESRVRRPWLAERG
jgi:GT2 family glycosyltransferase